jgi:D-3-phosphoglycerate dehydrogenase
VVRNVVLLTDHPWTDLDLERSLLEAAGCSLVAGPEVAPSAAAIEEHVAEYDPVAILTCWGVVSTAAISRPTELKIVARLGIGLDNIAVDAATRRGAWVTNVPDYCLNEVSDHAVALILAHFRGIARLDAATKQNGWCPNAEGLQRISDLTVGIIGYGRIGRATGRKLSAFGCRVIASDPAYAETDGHAIPGSVALIQSEAHVIVLHVPLMAATAGMIDAAFLAACRRSPLLVNVSRGGLVKNDALINALESGQVRGAAVDVIDGEPSPPPALFLRPDVIATPHIAFASTASIIELRRRGCEEVIRVLQGEIPRYPCNRPQRRSPLTGGVASDINVEEGADGLEVVKKALPKLKVEADWFSDPARSSVEVAAIRAFGELIGCEFVPHVIWAKPEEHTFAMRLIDARLRNWKRDLLDGRVDLATARRVGELLGKVHTRSAGRTDLQRTFVDTTYFQELRVEPFFRKVAKRLPDLKPSIEKMLDRMEEHKSALVHGDYSPKNILADGPEVVILDFEVAHWGDPRFDVAFCASHLLLKALRSKADRFALLGAARTFLSCYAQHGPKIDDADLVGITGCLMLARFEGSSPVEYLGDIERSGAIGLATSMIADPPTSLWRQLAGMAEIR